LLPKDFNTFKASLQHQLTNEGIKELQDPQQDVPRSAKSSFHDPLVGKLSADVSTLHHQNQRVIRYVSDKNQEKDTEKKSSFVEGIRNADHSTPDDGIDEIETRPWQAGLVPTFFLLKGRKSPNGPSKSRQLTFISCFMSSKAFSLESMLLPCKNRNETI
jgi:hypothetical protein